MRGEDASVFTRPVEVTTAATAASPFGYYDIVPSGAAALNYQITYVDGRLTVLSTTGKVQVWPINRTAIQLRISSNRGQKATIQVFNEAGQPLVTRQHTLTDGINTIILPIGSASAAVYVVKVQAEDFKEAHKISIR